MTLFALPVTHVADAGAAPAELERLTPTSYRRVELAPSRTAATVQEIHIEDEEVVALELEGGFRLWLRGDALRVEAGEPPSRDGGPWRLVAGLPVEDGARGPVSWVIKALEVFGIDPVGAAIGDLAAYVERHNQNRLLRFDADGGPAGEGDWVPVEGPVPAAERPILLCLHGTFSSTAGSFGPLFADRRRVLDLTARYGDGLYAYEHRTLTEDPIDNLLALVPRLPDGARLHLLSHSRGGLPGDLLALGTARPEPFSAVELELIGADLRPKLERLGGLLQGRGIRVERFVRVASPSRGTTLASGRLDRWLSILGSLADLSGVGSPLVGGFVDLAVAVTRLATEPDELPGLAAMTPGSPLVRVLNTAADGGGDAGGRGGAGPVPTELAVVAGDVAGNTLWSKAKLLIPDLFYAGDHDLVVNTGSMYGGPSGPQRQFLFDRGPKVNHFSYFTNEHTAPRVVAALTGPYPPPGFAPITAAQATAPARALPAAGPPRPVLFVLPGIMGSRLAVDGRLVWLDVGALAMGGLAGLAMTADRRVSAEGLLGIAYGDVLNFFQGSHEVLPFAYDWRRSLTDNAALFAAALAPKLEQAERNRQPVRILAHSMGGLVVRALILDQPALWRRVLESGGRLVMLGTPNGGSWEIVRLLTARATTLKSLALLDLTRGKDQLLGIIRDFPGVLEMLPEDEPDLFAPAFWQRWHEDDEAGRGDWSPPGQGPAAQVLAQAAALRRRLREGAQGPEGMCYVAGQAADTPCDVQVQEPAGWWFRRGRRGQFISSRRGDGSVLWEDGPLPNLPTWYLPGVAHGDLARHRAAFPALRELLVTGTTQALSQRPPVSRGGERLRPMEEREPAYLPDADALAMSALGMTARLPTVVEEPLVAVRVVHGNLAFEREVVAVGHYTGDAIIGAEAWLDRVLGGRLRARQELDLYPGPAGTHAWFAHPRPDGTPRGALVVGLGAVGELTPAGLANSFARALLGYARDRMERGGSPTPIRLASLLIGTGAGGLDVPSALFAMLRGLVRANAALERSTASRGIRFGALTLVEIREDLAITAARALTRLERDPELAGRLSPRAVVCAGRGGHRASPDEPDPAWWHRLQVVGDAAGGLRFTFLTRRARAEESLLATQRALVDGFVADAVGDTADNTRISRTLFELLLPDALKDSTALRGNLVLVLDAGTARFPWELLQDRWSPDQKPPAIERGTLRQFSTARFRADPRLTQRGCALVIGEPRTGLVPLPGARAEAGKVRDTLAARGFTVTALIDGGAGDCLMALHADAWQVLHLAGHGVHEERLAPGAAPVSGMVIGPGQVLTAADVAQMRQVPELVFINCCHLGRTDAGGIDRSPLAGANQLAANLAVAFIEMGVRAVIAAGWAVDDAAALTFCETFYAELDAGQTFGEAVRRGREATWQGHPGVNTWGAYQCYGDPDFRTRGQQGGEQSAPAPQAYMAVSEAIIDLNNLAADAQVATRADLEGLRGRLREIDQRLEQTRLDSGEDWTRRGALLAARSLAAAELGLFVQAATNVDAALASDDPDIDRHLVEYRARYAARVALTLYQSGQTDQALELLNELAAEYEGQRGARRGICRVQTLASIYWRRVQVLPRTKRKAELEAIIGLYDDAVAQAGGETDPLDVEARLLWLAARFLLCAYAQKPRAELCRDFAAWCDRISEMAAREPAGDLRPDVLQWELDLLRLLYDREGLDEATLAARQGALAEGLGMILARGLSQRHWTGLDDRLARFEAVLGEASVRPVERAREAAIVSALRGLLGAAA